MVLIETERATQAAAGDKTALRDWTRALEATAPIAAHPQRLLSTIIAELARAQPDAPALVSAHESLTYAGLAARSNRYARWALDQGLGKGDVVGLMMPNRPEYMAIWLGLSRVGVVVALINTQLPGSSLAYCIDAVEPKHLIVAADFCGEFHAAAALLSRPKIWAHGAGAFDRIDRAVEPFSGEPLMQAERRAVTIADRALLIYTSGTTGLPKAANVSHRRLLQWSLWFAGLMNTGPADRLYDCLPMYHSVGGVVATGALLVRGGSVLIRDKFSLQHFWDDVAGGGCTLIQYIGELCRYLVNAPKHSRERAHRLRLCCGNGLKADIWEKFQERFAIPRILEFYAATEGNFSLYNVEGKIGAVGRVPFFLAHRFPLALVKFDAATALPARDAHGFCMRCATNETGEAIGRIRRDAAEPGGDFEGYTSAEDSERKILRDVFERGDAWYRTGDLMRMDANGFFYFVDRIGDTFRWKGENVSAAEVAATLAAFPGIKEASVYGVPLAGADGSAGMAAIVTDGQLDFDELREHLARSLPPYARPKFLRVAGRIATTTTFKHSKAELQREGFDPAATEDPIYFDDAAKRAFVPMDPALYARIRDGKVRL
ncbi:MAG: long-chain-acyl-CoA synthetase [Xanthobacteraceae bacterium]|nr:long-chain-acyl-CoA synthetase [Xanthobacteraceae bacterium]